MIGMILVFILGILMGIGGYLIAVVYPLEKFSKDKNKDKEGKENAKKNNI